MEKLSLRETLDGFYAAHENFMATLTSVASLEAGLSQMVQDMMSP